MLYQHKTQICTFWFYSVLLVRAITQLRGVPLATPFSAYFLISLKLRATALNASFVFVTLEQSRVLSGLSPPLQISQRVVPKPHLSVAKLRFWGFSMHSGGTQGIRSTNTDEEKRKRNMNKLIWLNNPCQFRQYRTHRCCYFWLMCCYSFFFLTFIDREVSLIWLYVCLAYISSTTLCFFITVSDKSLSKIKILMATFYLFSVAYCCLSINGRFITRVL